MFLTRMAMEVFPIRPGVKAATKYMNPNSLGDIIPLPADEKLATLSGKVGWDKPMKAHLPGEVRIINVQNRKLWLQTELDSSGNYSVAVPPGKYEVMLPRCLFSKWGYGLC